VYRVRIVERVGGFEAMSDVVGFGTVEAANERAKREAVETCDVLTGGWRISAESMTGGIYGALIDSPNVAGSILVMVQRYS
jgi:hypothetical protein